MRTLGTVLKGRAGYLPQRSSVRASFISRILRCRFSSVVCLRLGNPRPGLGVISCAGREGALSQKFGCSVQSWGRVRGRLLPDLSQALHAFQQTLVNSPMRNDQRDQRPGETGRATACPFPQRLGFPPTLTRQW